MTMKTKICTKCKEEKTLKEFYTNKNSRTRYMYECKSCNKKRKEKVYIENKEKIIGQVKTYYINNLEKIKVKRQVYYQNNKDYFRQNNFEYREQNENTIKRQRAEYRKTEKAKFLKLKSTHKRRNLENSAINNFKLIEAKIILFAQGYKCVCCGKYFDEIIPTIDHIKPLSKGGDLIKENVQYLCQSCNSRKYIKEIDYRSKLHKKMIETI